MMGPRKHLHPKLFYGALNIAERIPADHLLRRLDAALDWDLVRPAVASCYGYNGNESIDPIVLLKLMLLLVLENVRSERQLMQQLAYRLDWLWFCRLDLDDEVPDHSVLSKARRLWGVELFEQVFSHVLGQCMEAGLVNGSVLHVDATCIDGNVDTARLQPRLRRAAGRLYEALEAAASPTCSERAGPAEAASEPASQAGGRLMSPTDPDAGVTRSGGQTVCGYKDHRAVDDAQGIITATVTTDAAVNEGHVLEEVLDAHQSHTGRGAETVVADRQYGTGPNYRRLRERGATPCIPHKQAQPPAGTFGRDRFAYDPQRDCFRCPAGEELRPYHRNYSERRVRYRARPGVCARCPLRCQCTRGQQRRVERHMDQEHIDWADGALGAGRRRQLLGRRKAVAEGSFADGVNNHGLDRARWRGLWRARIQNLLVATCQNVRKLLRGQVRRARRAAAAARALGSNVLRAFCACGCALQR